MANTLNAQQLLNRLGGEAFVGRLIAAIETIGLATDDIGQKGKVTLTIVSSKPKGAEKGDGYVEYDTKLSTVPPSRGARATGLYVDEDGLHVDDPRQTKLELRAVPESAPDVRPVEDVQPVIREA